MVEAACAVAVGWVVTVSLSAALVPGSMRATRTSSGTTPPAPCTITWTPCAGPVQYGAVPSRTSSPVGGVPVWSMSSGWRSVHSRQLPSSACTRSWTATSVTDGSSRQVTPTLENWSVRSRDTVSAGTPGSSSPEVATSSAGALVCGALVCGALVCGALLCGALVCGALVCGAVVGGAVVGSSTPPGCTSPSVVTTASPTGSTTEPRAT